MGQKLSAGLSGNGAPQRKPFLKFAGGKQRLLKNLLPLLPAPAPGRRYIEPFLGAGSVLLNKDCPISLAGDANPDLMALWAAVQSRPAKLIDAAQALFVPSNSSAAEYRRIRDEYNNSASRFERAVRLLYLNRFGFNGLYRVNKSGAFNVPFGHPKAMPSLPVMAIEAAAARLLGVELHVGGFQPLLEDAGAGDVVYCDPPYLAPKGGLSFCGYTQQPFGINDHVKLRDLALAAANRGATVAISNHDNEATRRLYREFCVLPLTVHRSIPAKSASRGERSEVLAIVGRAPALQP